MTIGKLPRTSNGSLKRGATTSRRVRTGCLTCRERHLKCDESFPICIHCRKSNRECKRGVRLNFLDIKVHEVSHLPRSMPWTVRFYDESRDIAAEYEGGLRKYPHNSCWKPKQGVELQVLPHAKTLAGEGRAPPLESRELYQLDFGAATATGRSKAPMKTPSTTKTLFESRSPEEDNRGLAWEDRYQLSPISPSPIHESLTHQNRSMWQYTSISPEYDGRNARDDGIYDPTELRNALLVESQPWREAVPEDRTFAFAYERTENATSLSIPMPAASEQEFLRTAEEVRCMQAFVDDVGVWLDSFDREKHFSQLLPYRGLKSPMLLNSILACGARQLALKGLEKRETAHCYYNTANTQLLRYRENPDRNQDEFSATVLILKLCDQMWSDGMTMRQATNARDLMLTECTWNSKSKGIGSACFWLKAFLDVLTSLQDGNRLSWNPNQCGVTLAFKSRGEDDGHAYGEEEVWVRRILRILAKIVNFRSSVSMFSETDLRNNKTLESRFPEWQELKQLCDRWNDACPRSMHPLGYLPPDHGKPRLIFPRVWLPKREAVFGRLLYHTAECILNQTNPMEQTMLSEEMSAFQLHHAHEVCGIVAHSNDPGIGLIAVQSVLIASRVLVNYVEQKEVLSILERIGYGNGGSKAETQAKLKELWGWNTDGEPPGLNSGGETSAEDRHLNSSNTPAEETTTVSPQLPIPTSTPSCMCRMDISPEKQYASPVNMNPGQSQYPRHYELHGLPSRMTPP